MESKVISDSTLVKDYIDGCEKSLEILILRHKQRIFSFIRYKVLDKEIAEDIFQDAFIKVINTLKKHLIRPNAITLSWPQAEIMLLAISCRNANANHRDRNTKMR